MKKIYFIFALVSTAFTQNSFAQDSTNRSQIFQLLSLYYNIKDALVASNANAAASKAEAFAKATNTINSKLVSEGNIKNLAEDAGKISQTKDLKKQREYFASLSTSIIAAAKGAMLSNKPIYQAYCPMKKAYWLSNEKAIKNPYYGSSMLTCGEVTATLQ